MLSNSKKLLTALLLVAVGVIGVQAEASLNTNSYSQVDGRHDSRDHGRRDRDRRDRDRYERWQCTTASRGYTFRAEGYSQPEAQRNVIDMCMRHPYGSMSECRYNARCNRVSGGGYPYPYPPAPPSGQRYVCQTFDGFRWVQGQGRTMNQARDNAMNQCLRNGGHPNNCQRHLSCRL